MKHWDKDADELVECLPSVHKAWEFNPPARQKHGMVAHAANSSTGRWCQTREPRLGWAIKKKVFIPDFAFGP